MDRHSFKHCITMRSKQEVKNLIRNYGNEGYGIYISILEFANYNKGSLPLNVELISDSIPADIEIVRYIVYESGLFKAKEGRIYSEYLADIENKKTSKKKPVKLPIPIITGVDYSSLYFN